MHLQNSNFVVEKAREQRALVPSGIKNPLSKRLAFRLSELRCSKNLASTAIAEAADISRSAAHHVEDERHIPRLDTVEAIATALNVSPTYLAFGFEGTLVHKERRPRPPLPPDQPEVLLAKRPSLERWKGIGERLRLARMASGQSLRDLTRIAKISPQGILLIENGVSVPRVSTAEEIARAVGVSPGWLAFGEGEGPAKEEA